MTNKTIRYFVVGVVTGALLLTFTACTESNEMPEDTADIETSTFPISSQIQNSYRIPVEKLVLQMNSNLGDTVRDTVFLPDSIATDTSVTFQSEIEGARALRWWNVSALAMASGNEIVGYTDVGPFKSKGEFGDSIKLNFTISRDILGDTPTH